MIEFITVLAYIFGIGAIILIMNQAYTAWLYHNNDKRTVDRVHNRLGEIPEEHEVHFPVTNPVIISAICWAWIIAF